MMWQTTTIGPGTHLVPHGYPVKIFLEAIDNKYLCTFCRHVLRNPIQSFCGHRFCKDCIQYLISRENHEICPACVGEGVDEEFSSLNLEKTFPDNAIKREFFSMRTVCPFEECKWSGPFKDFEFHYTSCDHRDVDCECGTTYPLSRQKQHLENDCLLREIECSFCKSKIIFKDTESHNEECMLYPIECPVCKKSLPRQLFPEHSKSHQGSFSGTCLCDKPVSERDFASHLEQNMPEHMNILFKRVQLVEMTVGNPTVAAATGNSSSSAASATALSLSALITGLERKLKTLEEKVTQKEPGIPERPRAAGGRGGADSGNSSMSPEMPQNPQLVTRVSMIEEKMKIYEGVVTVLNREVERITVKMDPMERQIPTSRAQLDDMERKVKSLERMIALKDVAIGELEQRITTLEQTSYDGTLLWRVTDFNRKRQDAISGRTTSFYSPAFYTSKTGYKMCARLYPNGDGMGKGTHVSLFFVVMRGQYDALLKWPFTFKVTLMLIDQNGKENVMDAFRPDPTSSSFKRPTTEMNIASGCPLFMSLNLLDSTTHAYVKDNIAFVKIILSGEGLN